MPNSVAEHRWAALLGQKDAPTDALQDYCEFLARSLHKRECSLEIFRIPWAERGWRSALNYATKLFAEEKFDWVLVQYTALQWSRRGVPLRLIGLLKRLKKAGARIVIVFHDPLPWGGLRIKDRLRQRVQLSILRRAARLADKIVTTISPDRVPWLKDPALRAKTVLMSVGSNIPAMPRVAPMTAAPARTIVLFGSSRSASEIAIIASVLSRAAQEVGPLKFIVFGRGAEEAGALLQPLLGSVPVELQILGMLEPERAGSILANADVQLFVRSGLSSRRGSGIAGIVCGLPIVGFSDEETAFPITEAGVRLVPLGDREGLARELVAVLKQPALRDTLRQRNLEVAERYFSWDAVADAYLSLLRRT